MPAPLRYRTLGSFKPLGSSPLVSRERYAIVDKQNIDFDGAGMPYISQFIILLAVRSTGCLKLAQTYVDSTKIRVTTNS